LKQVEGLSGGQVWTAMAKHPDAAAFAIVSAGPVGPQKPLPTPTAKPAKQPSAVPEH
ncbi:insulinase family protein, partial [Pseudomonas aeruginosa]